MTTVGHVALVGAGPGDPALLTRRAVGCLRRADLVLYDALVDPSVLKIARRAQRFFVGKRAGRHALSQQEIHAVMIRAARRGRQVVRLKGGDPFVFGRGGEEALALAEAGIPFELVPGVSSLSAVPESVGIPITHRGVSATVTAFAANDVESLDAAALARVPGTLVAFMGGAVVGRLAERLIEHGRPASQLAAVISSGTTEREQVVTAPLGAIAAAAKDLPTPALVVIGDVVAVREALGALRRSAA
jgi:uroporphyrin-III C-methyltransferase